MTMNLKESLKLILTMTYEQLKHQQAEDSIQECIAQIKSMQAYNAPDKPVMDALF